VPRFYHCTLPGHPTCRFLSLRRLKEPGVEDIASTEGIERLAVGMPSAGDTQNVFARSRRKTLKVNIPYRGWDGPVHLLIDSTGIKVEDEGECNARKHGGTKRRV
jgi:hypothetical protein